MKKENYKRHLDKISCSDDFRKKMEEMLSSKPGTVVEYADSVTTVERADKIDFRRWGSLAASLVLLIGIGGAAVHIKNSMPDINNGNEEQNSLIIGTETNENNAATTALNEETSSAETTTTFINNEDKLQSEVIDESKTTTAADQEETTEPVSDESTTAEEETEIVTSKVTGTNNSVTSSTSSATSKPKTTTTKSSQKTTTAATTTTVTTTTAATPTDPQLEIIIHRYMNDSEAYEQLSKYTAVYYYPSQEPLCRILGFYCEYDKDALLNDFLSVIDSCTWTATKKSKIIGESVVVGGDIRGFNFTRDGEMMCGETGKVYKVKTEEVSKIRKLFDSIVNVNDAVSLQYRLFTKAKNYHDMEADVNIYYDKNILDMASEDVIYAEGKMYYENYFMKNSVDSYGKYYYYLNGDNDYSGEFYRDEDCWAFVEKGDSIAESYFDYNGFDSIVKYVATFTEDGSTLLSDSIVSSSKHDYQAVCIDYDELHSDALNIFDIKYDTSWDIIFYSQYSINGVDCVSMEYESPVDYDQGYTEIIECRVDERGTVVYMRKGKRSIETGKAKTYLEFTLGDGYGGGINYDDSDFAIPQPSDEVMDEYKYIDEYYN